MMDSIQEGRVNEDNCAVRDLNPHIDCRVVFLAVISSLVDIKEWRE